MVIAEAANPEWVSVPLVGWSLAHALRAVADVHLVTQIRNRDAILRAGLVEGADFTAIDSEALAGPLWRLAGALRMGEGRGWTMVQALGALSYPWFEHLVWREFGPRLRAGAFDIVHRITPLSPTVPSPIAARCRRAGVPFVIGPLNGGLPWPRGFEVARLREREWLSHLRGAHRLLPHRRATLGAAAVIVGSRHTEGEMPAGARAHYLPENGIDPGRFAPGPRRAGGPLRVCFIGRMVPYKGPDMLLEAAEPLLRAGRVEIEMIGDGPMLYELRRRRAGPGVRFRGWLDHAALREVATGCDVLAFPSIREFGGGAVLEAMALGLAPLVVDYGGPGELVRPGTGYKVALGPRAGIVAGFRAALGEMAANREEVARTGAAARAHVLAEFTWAAKAARVAEIYAEVLEERR
ncbi:glycosyltransferase family 4 protein [Amaricoccus solimangrovi]|nr:glycosyltransferase family 4 protein [Amaricoccus solimangrovi]